MEVPPWSVFFSLGDGVNLGTRVQVSVVVEKMSFAICNCTFDVTNHGWYGNSAEVYCYNWKVDYLIKSLQHISLESCPHHSADWEHL